MRAMTFCLIALLIAGSASASVYTGSLTYSPPYPAGSSDGLFVGPSDLQWATYNVTISWEVTDEDANAPAAFPWKYTYTFGHDGPQAAISHIIIESSPTFDESNLVGLTGASLDNVGAQTVLAGNPNMPEALTGLRFDPLTESPTSMTWSFYSDRDPVWGDFYARCGGRMGGINFAYNFNDDGLGNVNGFTVNDVDPLLAAQSGSVDFHILRPDTLGSIPEPATLAMLMLAGGYALARRRR